MEFSEEQISLIIRNMHEYRELHNLDPVDAYHTIVESIDAYISKPEYTSQIKCGSIKNCSFCCHDTIPMGIVEGQIIKDYIVDNNISFNKERVIKQNSGEDIKWMDKACPLLEDEIDGERKCSIYEHRPLICRTHNSHSDPMICKRDTEEGTVEVMISQVMALSFISYELGTKPKPGDVPVMTSIHEVLNELK